jgi:DNA repair exonuclease SbcCD nuclease subunit
MHNLLLYSDLHINQSSLTECFFILKDIGMLAHQYKCDTLINCGDTFDFYKPTSSELDLFSTFIKRLGPDKQHIILAANSHESETNDISIINHFGILSDNIKVVKEFIDGNKLYVGHFGLSEANLNKYGATHSSEEFSKFNLAIFGHFHSFEKVGNNCCQLGSCRYIDFGESQDPDKKVLIIEGYDTAEPKLTFISLKSPYKMIDLILNANNGNELEKQSIKNTLSEALQAPILSQKRKRGRPSFKSESPKIEPQNPPNSLCFWSILELTSFLDGLDPNTKVRIIFKDYSLWSEFLNISKKYKDKFTQFVEKKDFLISINGVNEVKNEKTNLKTSLKKWMETNQTESKIQEILLKEIK